MSEKPDPSIDLETVQLRPACEEDESFFFEAFASDRAAEFSALGLDAVGLNALLRMQFDAQRSSYLTQFPDSRPSAILLGGRRIGRLWLERSPDEIRLLDLLVIPECRDRGIGTVLMRRVLSEATQAARPVRLMVAQTNVRAIRFYDRLGFRIVGEAGAHWLMEHPLAET